ncbi:hypothetical protein G9A89_001790 [Geosiphon pyriformis]|nr:hypothetical protein G9A89_001790 [Geosiphon pyriformis]
MNCFKFSRQENSSFSSSFISSKHAMSEKSDFETTHPQDFPKPNYLRKSDDEVGRTICRFCRQPLSHIGWCGACEKREFITNWPKWDSGNLEINSIIEETQFQTRNRVAFLEWIPANGLVRIPGVLGEGGTGSVSAALWADGPRKSVQRDNYPRYGPTTVAIKSFKSQKLFIKELRAVKLWLQRFNEFGGEDFERGIKYVIRCYGVTWNEETRRYELVYQLANNGTLREYLDQKWTLLNWQEKLRLTKDIALGLQLFHKYGLVHGDFNTGNILMHNTVPMITDLAMCRGPENDPLEFQPPFGLVPYIAPEVWCKDAYTQAADIYSFAIVMYEISTGSLPFSGFAHDSHLKQSIIEGKRPKLAYGVGIPNGYLELIHANWGHIPEERFSIDNILAIICKWYGALLRKSDVELMEEFYKAESRRIKVLGDPGQDILNFLVRHPQSVYTSRILDEITLKRMAIRV